MGRKAPNTQPAIVSFEEVRKSAKKGKSAGRQFVMPKASKRKDLFSGIAKSEPLPSGKGAKKSKLTRVEKKATKQQGTEPVVAQLKPAKPQAKKAVRPLAQPKAAKQQVTKSPSQPRAVKSQKPSNSQRVSNAQKASNSQRLSKSQKVSNSQRLSKSAKTIKLNQSSCNSLKLSNSQRVSNSQRLSAAKPAAQPIAKKKPSVKASAKDASKASPAKARPNIKDKVEKANQQEEAKQTGIKKLSSKLKERGEKKKRERNRAKAERDFNKRYGDASGIGGSSKAAQAAGEQAGPRAAVYKGVMGSKQKKSTKMQSNVSGQAIGKGIGSALGVFNSDSLKKLRLSTKFKRAVASVMIVAVAGFMLYGPAQEYYKQMRETDRLYAEYEAVANRTETLQGTIDSLQTEQGIEDKARTDLGFVKRNEQAASVKGITVVDDREFSSNIAPGSIPAPETWYSPFLDPFFGYSH